MNNQDKDVVMSRRGGATQEMIEQVEELPCPVCGEKKLIVDISMTLIQCDGCGICFEYRYNRGVIPYNTLLRSKG